jgi:hypothetical protein
MKIRIKGNTLRLRLSQSEVKQFAAKGVCEEQTGFPANTLCFGLKTNQTEAQISASFDDQGIWISIPQNLADHWTQTDEVGLSYEQPLPGGTHLSILVEKDFKCLHRDGFDESDLYPNPNR